MPRLNANPRNQCLFFVLRKIQKFSLDNRLTVNTQNKQYIFIYLHVLDKKITKVNNSQQPSTEIMSARIKNTYTFFLLAKFAALFLHFILVVCSSAPMLPIPASFSTRPINVLRVVHTVFFLPSFFNRLLLFF